MMLNRTLIRAAAMLLVLGAGLYGAYLLVRGADVSMPSLFQPPAGARLLISMDGFTFTQSENGKVSWRMQARTADLLESKEARLRQIEIVFADPEKNNRVTKLYGDTGTMDTVSGIAAIHRGSRAVRIVTSDGYLLTTDSLFWKSGERLIWTADPFKLLGSEIFVEGVGITANVDMGSLAVKDNVKAVFQK
jgi:hypothetical protein